MSRVSKLGKGFQAML